MNVGLIELEKGLLIIGLDCTKVYSSIALQLALAFYKRSFRLETPFFVRSEVAQQMTKNDIE